MMPIPQETWDNFFEQQGVTDSFVDCLLKEEKRDEIDHPSHYASGDVECIEAMRSMLSPEEYRGHLRATAMKYLWRAPYKDSYNGDIAKAVWYLEKLLEETDEP